MRSHHSDRVEQSGGSRLLPRDSISALTLLEKLMLVGVCALSAGVLLAPARRLRATTQTDGPESQAQRQPGQSPEQQADAAYQQGTQLLGEKQYGEALKQFQLVERLAPHLPQGPSGQGIALALMGKPEEAIEALKKALHLDPSFWVARRELGIVYWSQGLKNQAYQELKQVVQLFPQDLIVNVILGQYEFEQGNFAQALSDFSKAPAPVEQDTGLSIMRARALLKTDQKVEAGQVLATLRRRASLTPEQRFQIAWALGQAELYQPAIDMFNSLPQDYPDRFSRNYGLALAYFENKQYADCVRVLKPLEADNSRPELFSLLGVAEEKAGDTKAAYDAFRQAIISHPDDAQNYLNIATLSCLHLNYDLALQLLSSGIDRIRDDHQLLLSRGIAYTLKGQFVEAREDYRRSISLAPQDPGNYVALGLCELETGHLDAAVQAFQKADALGSQEPKAYYFLAETLIQRGVEPGAADFVKARQALDKALSLDSSLSYAYLDRAKLALQANQTEQAVADLERARTIDPNSRSIAYLLAQAYQRKGEKTKADALFARVKGASEEEARQFRRDALTQALVVLSTNDRSGP